MKITKKMFTCFERNLGWGAITCKNTKCYFYTTDIVCLPTLCKEKIRKFLKKRK